ncbi:MAG: hypothetical protein OXP75_04955 [Rhodospirillales bacterium]|nr:hypothetical protein [Rhodospirillales bacterium]
MRKSKPGRSIYLEMGVWYDEATGSIHMTAKGVHGFHTTERRDPELKRGHPNLFDKLAKCLRDSGAPAPQGSVPNA